MLWISIGVLALVAGLVVRHRITSHVDRPTLTDEDLRRIESGLPVEVDEPLDLQAIRDEEEEFWSESWDEPEDPYD